MVRKSYTTISTEQHYSPKEVRLLTSDCQQPMLISDRVDILVHTTRVPHKTAAGKPGIFGICIIMLYLQTILKGPESLPAAPTVGNSDSQSLISVFHEAIQVEGCSRKYESVA